MCDTSWWAMMIHMVSHWIHQELHQEPGQEDPGRSCHKRLCCKSWEVNCCKWWKNAGKMMGKWWKNGEKCWKPNVTEASTALFCAQILQENGKPDCMTLSTMPTQQMTNTWTFKKGDLYTRVNSLVQHRKSYKSKLHIQMLNFTGNNRHPPTVNSAQCQLLIWVSVGLWTYGRHWHTEEQRIFATDLARLTILYLSFEMPR